MGTEKGIRVLFSEFYAAIGRLEGTKERNKVVEWLFRNSRAFKRPGMTAAGEGTVNIEREAYEKLRKINPAFCSSLEEAHSGVRPEEIRLGEMRVRIKETGIGKAVREYPLPEFVRKALGAGKFPRQGKKALRKF